MGSMLEEGGSGRGAERNESKLFKRNITSLSPDLYENVYLNIVKLLIYIVL